MVSSKRLFYLHLPVVIATINRNNQVNAIRNEHSHCSEGLGSKIQDDGTDLKGLRWCYARDRRIRRQLGFRAGKGFCIDHGIRPTASFTFAVIMLDHQKHHRMCALIQGREI